MVGGATELTLSYRRRLRNRRSPSEMASALGTISNKVYRCDRAIYEGRARGPRGRVMEIWWSGSLPFQSNARAKWVEEWEANEGHHRFSRGSTRSMAILSDRQDTNGAAKCGSGNA